MASNSKRLPARVNDSSRAGRLAKGLKTALGRFFSFKITTHGERGAHGVGAPARSPAQTIDVTACARDGRGFVTCYVVQIPADTPINTLKLATRAALIDQHNIDPGAIDSIRVHYDHMQAPVTLLDEFQARARTERLAQDWGASSWGPSNG